MNETLKRELMEALRNIDKLEVETKTAVDNMNAKIRESRDAKVKEFLTFIREQLSLLEMTKMKNCEHFIVLCCSDDWEGAPNACGSYCRPMGIEFITDGCYGLRCRVGRYFSGANTIDECVVIKEITSKVPNPRIWEQFIDRWGEKDKEDVEKEVARACKKILERRTKESAEKLECANKKYAEYFGGGENK